MMNTWLVQVHTASKPQIQNQNAGLWFLRLQAFPHRSQIIWEIYLWCLCPEGHSSDESEWKLHPPMAEPRSWLPSSVCNYTESSRHETSVLDSEKTEVMV